MSMHKKCVTVLYCAWLWFSDSYKPHKKVAESDFGREFLLLFMCPRRLEKHFVVLLLSLTPTAVLWLTKEIVWHLLNYWCTECDWLTCCWPAMTTGMHLVWKVPPTNTLVHTSSGYLGGTPGIINLIVWYKKRGSTRNIWIQKKGPRPFNVSKKICTFLQVWVVSLCL